jgi:hypothetical protein
MSASSERYRSEPLPYGSDQVPEESENAETPAFAGAGRPRRGLAAPDWNRIVEGTRFAGDVAVQQLREGRSLDPQVTEDEPPPPRSFRLRRVIPLALVIFVAAAAAFVIARAVAR